MAPLMARTVHDDPRLVRSGLAEGSLTCGYAVERVTRIELALSAWELYGAASPPPADWLTCGCADVLSVSDPDCPRWLLRSGTQRAREHLIRGVGKPSRTVWCGLCAGPIFHSCPGASGAVRRLGYSLGYSREAAALILDRLLFRPDISQVHVDRAGVMRCRRSLLLTGGCCRYCHRCCQPPVRYAPYAR